MRWIAIVMLVALVACTHPAAVQPVPQAQCKWPEIPNDGGCCRDLNENRVCDTIDFAAEITAQEQKEYEEAAINAQLTANRSGRYRQTMANELYANASSVKAYRFYYKGDEVVIANNSIARKLTAEYPLGEMTINGRQMKVIVNTVWLDFTNRTAYAKCVPPAEIAAQGQGTSCDEFRGMIFPVKFEDFAFKLPAKWLEEFLYRTPVEILPGSHVAKRITTMYRFTDLKDSKHQTVIWADSQTSMPLRVEVTQDSKVVDGADYLDFFTI